MSPRDVSVIQNDILSGPIMFADELAIYKASGHQQAWYQPCLFRIICFCCFCESVNMDTTNINDIITCFHVSPTMKHFLYQKL